MQWQAIEDAKAKDRWEREWCAEIRRGGRAAHAGGSGAWLQERLLKGREEARAALSHPDLPQPIRDLYKRAYDKADAALGLDDALTRKAALGEPAAPLGLRPATSRAKTTLYKPKIIARWVAAILLLAGLAVWFGMRPDPHAGERERSCKTWGISDEALLARCRESPEQERAAIGPFAHSAAEREIAWFNQGLSALAAGKTRANGNYPSRSLKEVFEAAGGVLGVIIGPLDGATFPAKGLPAKVFGVIVANEPDPDDSPDERISEARYFTLETEMPPPSATLDDQAIKELAERPVLHLDIESLNRHERQFIIDHCHPVWTTPCRATVLGHADEIAGRRSAGFTHVGIVADQVDIEPLNWSTARPGWGLSTRSFIER
jgi:hypothetical protein